MNRRRFLRQLSAALPIMTLGAQSRRAWAIGAAAEAGWRTFELTTVVDIDEPPGRTQLWLPVPATEHTDYQRRLGIHWDANRAAHAELVTVPDYGVQLLHVRWPDAKSVGRVSLVSRFATRDRRVDVDVGAATPATAESANALHRFLRPTALLPTDGVVKATGDRIVREHDGAVEQARAIYSWVVENTNRDPKTQGCGVGDVGAMLETGNLGGKCADINGLFVALARSVGIPARDKYGVRIADSQLGYRCLGKSGDVSKAQHCRAEFYAQGRGWVPVDPADVRKVMLEEAPGGLPMEDPKVQAARTRLFGSWEMNWVAYNHGHDVALPGSSGKPIPFLMYPHGESGERRLNSLDPSAFRYAITSREMIA
jgi:transglutaminase-like putative cysteine protease